MRGVRSNPSQAGGGAPDLHRERGSSSQRTEDDMVAEQSCRSAVKTRVWEGVGLRAIRVPRQGQRSPRRGEGVLGGEAGSLHIPGEHPWGRNGP